MCSSRRSLSSQAGLAAHHRPNPTTPEAWQSSRCFLGLPWMAAATRTAPKVPPCTASATKAAATTPPPAPPAPASVPFVHMGVLTTAPPLPTGMPFVRVHGVLSDGRRLDCVVSDAPTAAGAFDGTILVGSEADAATGAAAEAAAAAVDANATDASAPAEACAVLSTDGSAHVHVGCEVEGGRWWIKARLEDGAWLLSRGEGYKVQNVELLQRRV